jgi:hypothetical protein
MALSRPTCTRSRASKADPQQVAGAERRQLAGVEQQGLAPVQHLDEQGRVAEPAVDEARVKHGGHRRPNAAQSRKVREPEPVPSIGP